MLSPKALWCLLYWHLKLDKLRSKVTCKLVQKLKNVCSVPLIGFRECKICLDIKAKLSLFNLMTLKPIEVYN